MEENQPTLYDVFLARYRIKPYLPPTPLLYSASLGRALGCKAYVKCENTQPVGAFKVRGGINLVAAEYPGLRNRGLTAASTGNHGQSVAYAASIFGLPATIFAPLGANPLKVAVMEGLGAEVRLAGRDFDEAREACERLAADTGARYVHSMNEPLLIAGVATCYLEAIGDVPDAEVVLVPIGGGSGAAGACIVAKSLNPGIRVIGVQAEGAPAVYRSYHSRRLESTEQLKTIAEGLATRVAFELPLNILWRYLDDLVLVSDDELEAAMCLLLETTHQVAESAGAAAVAAALRYPELVSGRKVILPITGGNATLEQIQSALRKKNDR